MSDNKIKLSRKAVIQALTDTIEKFRRYSFLAFLVFVGVIYGFVLFRVNSLSRAEPSESSVTSQVKAAKVPHIDESVVKQLESLQDNSVSVQALFEEARSNPFQ